jgi:hypothetical protein
LLLSSEELFPFLTPNYLLNIISCDLMFLSRLLFRYRLLISHCVNLIAFQDSPLGLGPFGLRWARPSGEKVFYFKIVQAHILKFSFFLFSLKFFDHLHHYKCCLLNKNCILCCFLRYMQMLFLHQQSMSNRSCISFDLLLYCKLIHLCTRHTSYL